MVMVIDLYKYINMVMMSAVVCIILQMQLSLAWYFVLREVLPQLGV